MMMDIRRGWVWNLKKFALMFTVASAVSAVLTYMMLLYF